jgi:hypothetical protein
MKTTNSLPADYHLAWSADIEKDKWLMVLLQVIAIPWSLVVLVGLGVLVYWLRPDWVYISSVIDFSIWQALSLLPVMVFAILLHEMVHGFFFWLLARQMPKFGFSLFYAYAALPGWYFDKSIYWLVGLSPLIVLSLVGTFFLLVVPEGWLIFLLFGLFTNASGAIGDVYIVTRLAFEPRNTLIEDTGTGFRVFRRSN